MALAEQLAYFRRTDICNTSSHAGCATRFQQYAGAALGVRRSHSVTA